MNRAVMNLTLTLFLSGILVACSSQVAGGTSETTSGSVCVGTALLADGVTPASGASIYIRYTTYIADTSTVGMARIPDAIADSTGAFALDSIYPGSWVVEINYRDQNVGVIPIAESQFNQPNLSLGKISLRESSTLLGRIDRSGLTSDEQAYVQIYGLERVIRTDSNGYFSFLGLPEGQLVLRIHTSKASHGIISRDSLAVNAAEIRDAGAYRLPIDFWRDTVIIRAILDSNGLADMPVAAVAHKPTPDARINELNLTRLGITTLPPELLQLRLKHLRLDYNILDSLPSDIGSMTSLNDISVAGNRLQELPSSIINLIHLGHLNATENAITDLPEGIVRLTGLYYLNLDSNRLNSLPISQQVWLDQFSTNPDWKSTQKP